MSVSKQLQEAIGGESTGGFMLHLKWPDQFGKYGSSKVTDQEIDRYVDKVIGKTVRGFEKKGLKFDIRPTIPGRDRKGNPLLTVSVHYKVDNSMVPSGWSSKFTGDLKKIKEVLRIK